MNYTIRQENNNTFVNIPIQTFTYSPILDGDELFSTDNLQIYNDCDSEFEGNTLILIPSGQHRSSQYIEVDCEPNQIYRLSCNAYFEYAQVLHKDELTSTYVSFIAIGKTPGGEEYLKQQITDTDTTYNLDVIPTEDKIYVSLGFGELGVRAYYNDISFKNLVPFDTYDQTNGTFYVGWDAVAADTDIIVFGQNSVRVNSSNNIQINTVEYTAQQATNRVAFRYSANGIDCCIDGGVITSNSEIISGNVSTLVLDTSVNEFSYVPVLLTDSEMQTITHV